MAMAPPPDRVRDSSTALWSNASLSQAMSAVGCPVSQGYIKRLRAGEQNNPTGRVLLGLCLVFGCPPAYWFDQAVAAEHDARIAASRRANPHS